MSIARAERVTLGVLADQDDLLPMRRLGQTAGLLDRLVEGHAADDESLAGPS